MASIGNAALLESVPQLTTPVRIAIVKTAWNAAITKELEAGAQRVLAAAGITDVHSYTVPGAVEVPYMVQQLANSAHDYADAYIAFACVIKGDTPHFDYVCQSITQGITQLNITLPSPVIYGVLTVLTQEQAQERIGGKHGHKGEEAAITALQMIAAKRALER